MGLETGTRIEDLDASNPVPGDAVSQGQDHLTLIKTCVKGSFPSLGASAVTATAEQLNILTTPTSSLVTSFNARTGNVVPYANDYSLVDLSDTFVLSPTNNEYLAYNGSFWVPTFINKSVGYFETYATDEIGETLLIPTGTGDAQNAANHIQLRIYNLKQASTLVTPGQAYIELGDSASYSMTSEGLTISGGGTPNLWTSSGGAMVGPVNYLYGGMNGVIDLHRQEGTNRWIVSGLMSYESSAIGGIAFTPCGYITLASPADRLRVTLTANTFATGQVDVRVTG